MNESIPEDQQRNYELFRDCLATAVLERISEPDPKPRRRAKTKSKKKKAAKVTIVDQGEDGNETIRDPDTLKKTTTPLSPKRESQPEEKSNDDEDDNKPPNADDLADFTDYLATSIFASLSPSELKTVDYHDYTSSPTLQAHVSSHPLPLTSTDVPFYLTQSQLAPDIVDSLSVYGITDTLHSRGENEFLAPILTSYLTLLSTAPPPPSTTKEAAGGCELCGRDYINLSYHHLIPRFVHAKVVRRGWHRECDLQNVAWLCGACHRFVHRFKGHEELARRYYTVELLLEEEEVRRWAEWVGRLRWKGR